SPRNVRRRKTKLNAPGLRTNRTPFSNGCTTESRLTLYDWARRGDDSSRSLVIFRVNLWRVFESSASSSSSVSRPSFFFFFFFFFFFLPDSDWLVRENSSTSMAPVMLSSDDSPEISVPSEAQSFRKVSTAIGNHCSSHPRPRGGCYCF